jgi:predicted dehydrogenase
VWRPYATKHGLDELRAVPGAKLTIDDVNQLRVFALSRRWGVPASFDDVPALIREPDLEQGPPDVGARVAALPFVAQRSRPIRLLLLGSGRQARRIARAAERRRRSTRWRRLALQADAHDFGSCPLYADAAAAMDDMRPEAVIVAAATAVHDELARLAIARGIPALVEKPIANDEAEATGLRDAAWAAGACLIPAHNSLFAAGLGSCLRYR